ncbi:glycerophosphodiester phosphodiesterase [Macrococcus equipercicus]|uniref:Glycerophosphodiester phosphodiesterase n=1 Tax=Macrococcus equipercicus TaxID=69967 RepID=A0ABQ6RBK8_9STAP|nr:glycerophosphodiester phosphodiesterase [Macrococcus equipercicus]KAA1042566.1 glycerophosphodiester phosphodiesterase [Macrococcus equipercicus]
MKKLITLMLVSLIGLFVTPPYVDAKKQIHSVIAHRGASGYAPEHTFASYDMSHFNMNADYIEVDLQMTKDGQLVAMHDETVDRTTNGTGLVKDYTLAELKALDAGSWFNEKYPEQARSEYVGLKVPTLDEVISRYGTQAKYYIETKSPEVYPGMEEMLLNTLSHHGLLKKNQLKKGHVLIQSFSTASLIKVHQLDAAIPLVKLMDKGVIDTLTDQQLKTLRNLVVGIGPNYKDLTAANTKRLHSNGLIVHPYTVNTEADMRRLNSYGVDGVFTNYPDVYKRINEEKKVK